MARALLADRFTEDGRHWLDLATGDRVRLRVFDAGSREAQIDWSAQCERIATLRHPLVAPLIDFGAIGGRLFEAYAAGHPEAAVGSHGESILAHAAQFLQHHRVTLTRPVADYLLRPVGRGAGRRERPLGIVLQTRRAFDAISDALDGAAPAGPCAIRVVGPVHSGLRTLRTFIARAARLHGYVPISPAVLTMRPELHQQLVDRHVCILTDDEACAAALAAFLVRLSSGGGRRHVVLHFRRKADPQPHRAVCLDAMGADAMTAMVFVGGDFAPTSRELLDAARGSDGRPGLFLARLGATSYEPRSVFAVAVHETAATYAPDRVIPAGPAAQRRVAAVLLRAPARADQLARRGRHASARRVLRRALRLLSARGERRHAAECARALGWLSLDRGQPEAAVRQFERARDLSPDGAGGVLTSIGIGDACLCQGRLAEAEGAHRAAVVAARAIFDAAAAARATNGLARSLYWQGRYDEAAIAAEDALAQTIPCEARSLLLATMTRIHLAERAIAPAVRSARSALALAVEADRARAAIAAHEALAAALAGAGDYDAATMHARSGLALASGVHLPLDAARLRIALLDVLAASGDFARLDAMAARVSASCARLPPLLRFRAQAAAARARRRELDRETREFIRDSGARALDVELPRRGLSADVGDLQALLEIAYSASDERAGLAGQCAQLAAKLRAATVAVIAAGPVPRVVALTGRPWSVDPVVATRALATGLSVPAQVATEPCAAAEPVRYGGEVIAALGCRWIAGTAIDAARAAAVLRVGALAVAPGVRALLDRGVVSATRSGPDEWLGESAAACALREAAACAARAPFPVLIEGESGSGKELVARAIHRLGPRRERRLCAINCAALSEDLLEAELFGHVRGAFTGAIGDRGGLFEEADGGTLFLDEVGELSPRAQAKLLRVLQDGELRRVGETLPRRVDVRVVAATNRRLEQEVAAGRFRADLRFRLDVIRIEVPPLRDHPTDIPLLASHFWAEAAARVGCRATLSPDALSALARYDWPGNVRELQNALAWIAVHSPTRGRIAAAALPAHIAHCGTRRAVTFEVAREEFERRFVKVALATAQGRRGRAAEALGVTRQGLSKMLRRLGIDEAAVEGDL